MIHIHYDAQATEGGGGAAFKEEKIIMYDSPEAAQFRTGLSGWVSSAGHYFGKNEHLARYDGSTHKKCECGRLHLKNSYCRPCSDKKRREAYFRFPEVPFNEVDAFVVFDDDRYFFGEDDLLEYCENNDIEPEDLLLQVAEAKVKLPHVGEDYWVDDLPEDGGLTPQIQEALNALNKAIDEHSPTVYFPVNKRTTYKP